MSDLSCSFVDSITDSRCQRPVRALKLCHIHRKQLRAGIALNPIPEITYPSECVLDYCNRKHYARKLCKAHYDQTVRDGKEATPLVPRGRPLPIGTIRIQEGYVLEKDPTHPNAVSTGWVRQHIKIMSDHIGRRIDTDNESVHHRNGIKHDNRIENLELRERYHGKGQAVEDKFEYYCEFIEKYALVFPDKAMDLVSKLQSIL